MCAVQPINRAALQRLCSSAGQAQPTEAELDDQASTSQTHPLIWVSPPCPHPHFPLPNIPEVCVLLPLFEPLTRSFMGSGKANAHKSVFAVLPQVIANRCSLLNPPPPSPPPSLKKYIFQPKNHHHPVLNFSSDAQGAQRFVKETAAHQKNITVQ